MISRLLFERPTLLLVILVVVQFGSVCVWSRRRTVLSAPIVWIGFAAIPVLLLLSILVVTQREQVVTLCNNLAAMVEAGDIPSIGRHLSDDFEAGDLDRSAFLERAEQTLTRHHVDRTRLHGFEIEFPRKGQAVVTFNATCRVRSVDAYVDRVVSRWRVTLRRRGGDWLVVNVEALPTPFSPIRNLHDLLR